MTNSTEFPRGFPRKLEGVVGKRAGNTERKPGRVREETLGQAKWEDGTPPPHTQDTNNIAKNLSHTGILRRGVWFLNK